MSCDWAPCTAARTWQQAMALCDYANPHQERSFQGRTVASAGRCGITFCLWSIWWIHVDSMYYFYVVHTLSALNAQKSIHSTQSSHQASLSSTMPSLTKFQFSCKDKPSRETFPGALCFHQPPRPHPASPNITCIIFPYCPTCPTSSVGLVWLRRSQSH